MSVTATAAGNRLYYSVFWGCLALALMVSLPCPLTYAQSGEPGAQVAPGARPAIASAVALSVRQGQTHVRIALSRPVTSRVFTLAHPDRLIVDMSNLTFQLPAEAGTSGVGAVHKYRFGSLAPGRARLVFDLNAPVIATDRLEVMSSGRAHLHLVLTPQASKTSDDTTQANAETRNANRQKQRQSAASALVSKLRPGRFQPARRGPEQKPVVVIDPGHGGADPGALGVGDIYEKDIVLAVALRLRTTLNATGQLQIHMTRDDDYFVSLGDRAEIADKHRASVFLSLHADAIADRSLAGRVRGATVYTLAERASDRHARMLAEKENAADRFGPAMKQRGGKASSVRSILFDLIRRETANQSVRLREIVIQNLQGRIALSNRPRRSAAFKVLKQLGRPALLVEMGYMSNVKDQRLMATKGWQNKVAKAMTRAILEFLETTPPELADQ